MTLAFRHLVTGANGDTEIARTGLRVYTVLGLYEMGDSAEYIADEYDVSVAAVFEALAYAADHPDEMEAIRLADEAAEERIVNQLPEQVREEARRTLREHEALCQEAIRRTKEARRGAPVP
jgi:uncharacterized protein (DUF433 family)